MTKNCNKTFGYQFGDEPKESKNEEKIEKKAE